MAKTFRVTPVLRVSNAMIAMLLRAGLKLGPMALLTVPGRKSGVPRSTPVALVEYDGRRFLIGSFGEVNWVRNLRAAGRATLIRGGRTEAITAVELASREAASILKHVRRIGGGGLFTRGYFDVGAESPLEDFEREAPRHPVFLVRPAT
jgi:deazaflavin-dependent oxidoreductase (nitroreductase family)